MRITLKKTLKTLFNILLLLLLQFSGVQAQTDVNLDFGGEISGIEGEQVTIAVNTSDLTGLDVTNFDFEFAFDPALIQFEAVDITSGGLLSSAVTKNITSDNRILVSFASSTPISAAGTLFTMTGTLLAEGQNADGFSVTDIFMGDGSLTVSPSIPFSITITVTSGQPVLSIDRSGFPTLIPSFSERYTISVNNTGGGVLDWSASSSDSWFQIISEVTAENGSGNIYLEVNSNYSCPAVDRQGEIVITSENGLDSPISISFDQMAYADGFPELIARSVDGPSGLSIGSEVSIPVAYANTGDYEANSGWDGVVYLSQSNSVLDGSEIEIASFTENDLLCWDVPESNRELQGLVPADTPSGTYYYAFQVDVNNEVNEFSEIFGDNDQTLNILFGGSVSVTSNQLPSITILSGPAEGSVVNVPYPDFAWEGNDPDGTIASYEVDFQGPSATGFTTTETSHVFSDLTEGSYLFRVRAIDNGGAASAWAERNFTVNFTSFVPPVQLAPSDDATDVKLDAPFEWEPLEGADQYELHFNASNPTAMIVETNVDGTSYSHSELFFPDRSYSWRVRAIQGETVGEWSPIWSFTTEQEPLSPPGVVTLSTPDNASTDVSINPTLSWQSATDATSYIMQVSLTSDFAALVVDQSGVTPTELAVSDLAYETPHFWRVRAVNAAGQSDWSSVWSFTTEQEPLSPPGVVTLSSPDDGATDVSINPSLSWQSATDASSYVVQVSLSSDFVAPVVEQSGVTPTELAVSDLTYETPHFWRVRAVNATGQSDWSSVWSFTTEEEPLNPPGVVTLSSPADGATGVSVSPLFTWQASTDASTYDIQVSATSDFAATVVNETGIANTEFQAPALSYLTGYFWRVRAVNEAGQSDWSTVWSFTTEDEPLSPPGVVTLSSPSDGAIDVTNSPMLSWQTSTDAASYIVQVSLASDFAAPIVDESGVTATELAVSDLAYEMQHFWRVRAVNAAGQSDWSSVWIFTTSSNEPPTISILSGPADGSTIDFNDPGFVWEGDDSDGTVQGYEVDLKGPSPEAFATTETTHLFSGLANGQYTFRVQAIDNEGAASEWAVRTFTVAFEPPEPDLIVSNLTISPTSPKEGDTVTITFEIINQGDGLADTFDWRLDVNENEAETGSITSLEAGESTNESTEIQNISSGSYTIFVTADVNGQVVESNEDNNEASETFTVTADPVPVLVVSPTSIDVSSNAGTATFQVSNDGSGALEWSASTEDTWLTFDGTVSGSGSADVQVEYTKNTSENSRNGTVTFTSSNAENSPVLVSIQQVAPQDETIVVTYSEGWNLVSIPEGESGKSLEDYFTGISGSTPFEFNGQYQEISVSLVPTSGKGYWLKLSNEEQVEFSGNLLDNLTLNLVEGWNLVGSIGDTLSVPADIQDTGGVIENGAVWEVVYDEVSGTYELVEATEMIPGMGYFIKATSDGQITLSK